MMGMVSGSSVANVASTGALTIPLMKRVGFQPEFAGAVEAVASTGGQITPPVMGLAARSEEHTSELQSLMRISYAVFCLKKKQRKKQIEHMITTETLANQVHRILR